MHFNLSLASQNEKPQHTEVSTCENIRVLVTRAKSRSSKLESGKNRFLECRNNLFKAVCVEDGKKIINSREVGSTRGSWSQWSVKFWLAEWALWTETALQVAILMAGAFQDPSFASWPILSTWAYVAYPSQLLLADVHFQRFLFILFFNYYEHSQVPSSFSGSNRIKMRTRSHFHCFLILLLS